MTAISGRALTLRSKGHSHWVIRYAGVVCVCMSMRLLKFSIVVAAAAAVVGCGCEQCACTM